MAVLGSLAVLIFASAYVVSLLLTLLKPRYDAWIAVLGLAIGAALFAYGWATHDPKEDEWTPILGLAVAVVFIAGWLAGILLGRLITASRARRTRS